MNVFQAPGTDPMVALRALKAVAMANGDFAQGERVLMRAAASAYHLDADVDAVQPIAPADLAAAITDPGDRIRILRACMLMSLADQKASDDEWSVVTGFRDALGVDDTLLQSLHDVAKQNLRLARFHMLRSAAGARGQKAEAALVDMLGAQSVAVPTTNLEERLTALAALPEGTFGHALAHYYDDNGFGSGDKSVPESLILHDVSHVISGYGTDPIGEIELGAFMAGMRKEDPFAFLMFVMLELHIGEAMSGGAPRDFDPDRAFRAHARGAQCKRDFTIGWDFWSATSRPLAELRSELGIA